MYPLVSFELHLARVYFNMQNQINIRAGVLIADQWMY